MTARLLVARGSRASGRPRPSRWSGAAAPRPESGMAAVFADVLRETDRGLTADRIAVTLGVPDDVVLLALEHAERVGLVVRSAGGSPCATGCPTGPDKPLGCFGCPFSR